MMSPYNVVRLFHLKPMAAAHVPALSSTSGAALGSHLECLVISHLSHDGQCLHYRAVVKMMLTKASIHVLDYKSPLLPPSPPTGD